MTDRPYPILFTDEERKSILADVEILWAELQGNELGGFSDINRPFYILHAMKRAIEKYGYRDVGLTWSKRQLEAETSTLVGPLTPAEEAQIAHCQLSWIEEGGETHPRRIASIRGALNRMAKMEEPPPVSHVMAADVCRASDDAEADMLRSALAAAVETIQDYLAYTHDGDPWKEDSRAMGEMDINDYARDGRLEYALSLLKAVPSPQARVEPPLPAGFNREEIEEMLSIVEMEPQTVDGGGEWGPQESTDGWYTRLLRAILGKADGG